MATGKVCTGFSKPYVALYEEADGAISYSGGRALARGVDVSIDLDSDSGDNTFFADNVAAETVTGGFTGGTLNLTVDGLLSESEKLIMGLPAAGTDGFTVYDDDQVIPEVGVGFVARYMSDGVTSYVPIIITRTVFNQVTLSAATQEDSIDWQTQSLTATILRGGDAKHSWRKIGAGETSEAAAVAKIKAELNIQ